MKQKKEKQLICECLETHKKYKTHKWEYYQCDCPDCYEDHQHCARCYKEK